MSLKNLGKGLGGILGRASSKSQNAQSAQQAAAVQGLLSNSAGLTCTAPTISTNSNIPYNQVYITSGAAISPTSIYYHKSMLEHFTDEAIMEEYLKRFSPLAKAMEEPND